jgi:hypothetical protein
MKRAKDYLISILLSVLLILGHFGCATTQKSPHSIKSEGRHVLNVAIVPAEHVPQFNCLTYDKGRGRAAASKAGEFAGEAAVGGAAAGALLPIYTLPYGILLIPFLPILIPAGALTGAVIGGTSGAITGAIKGDYKEFPMDMEEAVEIKEEVENVYAMIAINRVLAGHIMKAGQELTDNKFKITTGKEFDSLTDGRDYRVFSPYNIDPVTGQDLADKKYTITRGKSPVSLTDGGDYPTLRSNDTDIILNVAVNSLEFMCEKGKDPDTSFEMNVDIKVIGARSRKESYPGNFAYASEERKLSDWTGNNAQLLQNEFKHCYQTLSERIIKKIFLSDEQNIEYLLLPEPQTVQFEIEKKQLTNIPNYHEDIDGATDNVETVHTDTDSQKIRLEKEKQYLAYIPKYANFKTITILDNTYHIGDNIVKRFENPKPQGLIFETRFNIPDTNLHDISITIWVSEMVPKNHKHFFGKSYQNKLVINDSKIDTLNHYIKGVKDESKIEKITIGLNNQAVKSGYNVIKIIAGVRLEKYNYDDFQIHRIILSYKNY